MAWTVPRTRLTWFALLAFLTLNASARAVTIDDFSQGAVTLVDSLGAGSVSDLKTGLSPAHTAATARLLSFNAIDPAPFGNTGSVTVKVDTANGGSLKLMPDPGLTAANFFINYGVTALGLPAMSLNLLAGGADRLILDFGYTIPDATSQFASFHMDILFRSGNGQTYSTFPLFPNSTTPFSFEMPFSEIKSRQPNLDLTHITNLRFGTANGTMQGTFELREIRTNSTSVNGDFNFDGVVNAADYVVWRNGYPGTYGPTDLDAWRANFGVGSGAGANANQVPEPGSLGVLVAGVLGLWMGRRR
jgi:hypothetical protein